MPISESLWKVLRRLTSRDPSGSWPTGIEFFRHIDEIEEQCVGETDRELLRAGQKAPRALAELGSTLLLLDCAAACHWGCRGSDHVYERLLGRIVSSMRGALRLMRAGYYDEALAVVRNAGETVNLLFLFESQPTSYLEWSRAGKQARWGKFKPSSVRKRLEGIGSHVPIDLERYDRLTNLATHVSPSTSPQSYNPFDIPALGAVFQLEGAVVTLNEIALVAALASVPAASLILHDRERKVEILNAGRNLAEQLGALDTTTLDRYRATRDASSEGARPRPDPTDNLA